MEILREFLESSTIHGVSYISSAKVDFENHCLFLFLYQEKAAKVLWFVVVSLGFLGAGFLIGNSYNEWQKNPIGSQ